MSNPPISEKIKKTTTDTLGVHVRLNSVTELTERDNFFGRNCDALKLRS
jgi:hypothetical protein